MSNIARLYNLLHTGNPGDLEYYLQQCLPGMRVLELGAGAGRISAALHRRGCHVEGIDNDPHMCNAFQQTMSSLSSPPPCHLADMRTFNFGQKYDRILIPFNGLLCMLSEADVVQVFRQAKAHLADDGELIFDVYYVSDDFENDGIEDDAYIDTAVIDDCGVRVDVYEKTLSTDDPQRFDTSYIYVINGGTPEEQQIEHTILQRCLYVHQIRTLLAETGFPGVRIGSDFSRASADWHPDDNTGQITVHAAF
jgi:SAM-dependent methyltransferase